MKRCVRESFKTFDRHAMDLVEKNITMDLRYRISAKNALDAKYS